MFRIIKKCCLSRKKAIPGDFLTYVSSTCKQGAKPRKPVMTMHCHLNTDAVHRLSPSSLVNSVWFRASSTEESQSKTEGALSTRSGDVSQHHPSRCRQPTNSEKKMFVWTGKYKTVEEVPDFVSEAALTNVKSRFRIYINMGMGVATLIAAIAMIIIGKSRARKGESISKLNMERHPEIYQK